MQPVLSVIIACLDAAETLGTQLDALARQSGPVPWEVIVADNGSTDGSLDIARAYHGRLPGLRIVDASTQPGAGPARNLGVQAARGRWIAFCDADDEVAPDWIAALCRALERHRFVAGRFEQDRLNDARVLRSRSLPQHEGLQTSPGGPGLPHAGGGNLGMHREDFLRVGGFDPAVRWLEDTDLSWRAQLAGVPLAFCPDVVVHVRLRRTFRSMFLQGMHYGFAQAVLEERYGGAAPAAVPAAVPGAVPGAVAGGVPGGVPGAVVPGTGVGVAARMGDWFVDHLVGGRLFWRLGWVVGHRRRRRAARRPPSGADAAPPSGADAWSHAA